jgi:hypothetical protein
MEGDRFKFAGFKGVVGKGFPLRAVKADAITAVPSAGAR